MTRFISQKNASTITCRVARFRHCPVCGAIVDSEQCYGVPCGHVTNDEMLIDLDENLGADGC